MIRIFLSFGLILFVKLICALKISLLVARNERESVQIALRPKVSWGGSSVAGVVQVQCTDLCSTSGDRFYTSKHNILPSFGICFRESFFLTINGSDGQVGGWTIIEYAACGAYFRCA